MFGYIVSTVSSLFLSKFIFNFVYSNFVEVSLFDAINLKLMDIMTSSNLESQIDLIYSKMPQNIINTINLTIGDKDYIYEAINQGSTTIIESISNVLSQNVFKSFVNSILQPLIFILLFFLINFIIKIILSFATKLLDFSFLGKINSILGGAFGILKSTLILFFICTIVYLIVIVTSNDLKYINDEIIDKTFIFKIIYYFNPFLL